MNHLRPIGKTTALWWFAGVLLLLLCSACGTEITRIDIRFALMVEDMAEHGIGIFPTINGMPYADYPSPYIFLSYLTTLGGRVVTLLTLTLPTLLLGAYIITMTLVIGERIRKNLGILAAALSLLTMEYCNIFMSFGIDVPVAAAGVTMLYLFLNRLQKTTTVLAFAGLLILCFVIRGPLGLILLGAGVGGCLIAARCWKWLVIYGVAGMAAAALCAGGGYWLLISSGGDELWQLFLDWQINSRFGENVYWYYFTNALVSFAPVTLVAVAGLVFLPKRLFSPTVAAWLGFLLCPLVVLSIPGCKHLRYMTLVIPACALLGAYCLLYFQAGRSRRTVRRIAGWINRAGIPVLLFALLVLAIVGFCLLPVEFLPLGHWILAALLLGLALFRFDRRIGACGQFIRFSGGVAVFYLLVLFPFSAMFENSRSFVAKVEAGRQGNIYFYELGPDHDDLKYLLHIQKEQRNQVTYTTSRLRDGKTHLSRMYPSRVFSSVANGMNSDDVIIVLEKNIRKLTDQAADAGRKPQIIQQGKLGHRACLAVKLVPSGTAPAI